MIKKRKIKALYMNTVVCDKCGSIMNSTGITYPACPMLYGYKCSNPDCNEHIKITMANNPGQLIYEFEEDKDKDFNNLFNQTVAKVKNNPGITYLKKKVTVPTKTCPHCGEFLEYEVMRDFNGNIRLIYECPNDCKLSFSESNEFFNKENKEIITYEEEKDV